MYNSHFLDINLPFHFLITNVAYVRCIHKMRNAPLFTVIILNMLTVDVTMIYLRKCVINIFHKYNRYPNKTKPYKKKLNPNEKLLT